MDALTGIDAYFVLQEEEDHRTNVDSLWKIGEKRRLSAAAVSKSARS